MRSHSSMFISSFKGGLGNGGALKLVKAVSVGLNSSSGHTLSWTNVGMCCSNHVRSHRIASSWQIGY